MLDWIVRQMVLEDEGLAPAVIVGGISVVTLAILAVDIIRAIVR